MTAALLAAQTLFPEAGAEYAVDGDELLRGPRDLQPGEWEAALATAKATLALGEPRQWMAIEFLQRFTPQERRGVIEAGRTDSLIEDFYRLCCAAPFIRADDDTLNGAFVYLISKNLLTAERAKEILTGS